MKDLIEHIVNRVNWVAEKEGAIPMTAGQVRALEIVLGASIKEIVAEHSVSLFMLRRGSASEKEWLEKDRDRCLSMVVSEALTKSKCGIRTETEEADAIVTRESYFIFTTRKF